jgi:hypothetical protein
MVFGLKVRGALGICLPIVHSSRHLTLRCQGFSAPATVDRLARFNRCDCVARLHHPKASLCEPRSGSCQRPSPDPDASDWLTRDIVNLSCGVWNAVRERDGIIPIGNAAQRVSYLFDFLFGPLSSIGKRFSLGAGFMNALPALAAKNSAASSSLALGGVPSH